jgi:hypothetical protein
LRPLPQVRIGQVNEFRDANADHRPDLRCLHDGIGRIVSWSGLAG